MQEVRIESPEEGGKCESFALELRDVSSVRSCVKEVEQKMGSIEVLVNNAGMGDPSLAEEVTEEYWDLMMDLNLKGLFGSRDQDARAWQGKDHQHQ